MTIHLQTLQDVIGPGAPGIDPIRAHITRHITVHSSYYDPVLSSGSIGHASRLSMAMTRPFPLRDIHASMVVV